MAIKEVKEITEYINKQNFDDVVIALMNIEKNDGQDLSVEQYNKLKKSYDYYLNKRDDLTGILNEVLQECKIE